MTALLRLPAEQAYAPELQALARGDDAQKPQGWTLSPKAVLTYLLGGKAGDGTVISVSCTSEPMRVSSSSRQSFPSCMAR